MTSAPATQSLQKRLFVLTATLGVSVVVMMSLIFLASEIRHQRQHVVDYAAFFASLLTPEKALVDGHLDHAQRLMSSLDKMPALERACVYDTQGTLVASHHKPGFDRCPPAPMRPEATADLLITKPIVGIGPRGDEQIVGNLQILSDKWAIDDSEFDPIAPVLVIVAALIAIVLLVGRYLARSFVQPIMRLTENATNFDPAAPEFETVESRLSEVTELSRSFQRVVQTLIAARRNTDDEVTQRQSAQTAERASRELLRHIVDVVPFLIFAVQRNGSIIFANQAVAELYQESLDNLLEPTFKDNYRGPNPDGLLFAPFTNERGPDEVWFADAQGDSRRFLVRWLPYVGDDTALVIGADVTEEHRLQLQLQFSQRLEVIGTLAGGIAHDFNNLLTPILGYTSILLESDLPADALSKLRAVEAAGERARDVVQQILTFSRQQQAPKSREPIDVGAVVVEATDLLRASIPATVQFRVSAEQVGRVLADPNQLHQVIVNLCTNAAQAITGSAGCVDIRTFPIAPGSPLIPTHLGAEDYLCIEIQDNGCGIHDDVINHIFEPFFTTKDVGEGSGLGLSVVHGIVTGHGGDITVESRVGEGTTFRVLLPLAEAKQSEAMAGVGELVMLVDDEDSVLRVTTELLTNQGYQVMTFDNPTTALQTLNKDPERFGVMVTDHNMPDMTGAELARAVRRIRPDIPIILITGFTSSAASDLDAIDHKLMKPISGRELSMAIQSCLATRRPAA